MILRIETYIFVLLLSAYFSYKLLARKSWLLAAMLMVCLVSAAVIFADPHYTFDILSLRLRLVSARSFAEISMMAAFGVLVHRHHLERLLDTIEWIAVANLFVLPVAHFGLFNAGSMDMTFAAMVAPLFLRNMHNYVENSPNPHAVARMCFFLPLLVLCSFLVPGTTACLVLLISLGSYLVVTKRWMYLAALPVFPLAALVVNGNKILLNSDRVSQWKLLMDWWWNSATWFEKILGTGSGTFQWYGPIIQNKDDQLFVWMHNEYLQVLWEQGFVGLALMLCLLAVLIKKAYKHPWLFASVLGCIPAMFTQYPLRFPISALLIVLLIRHCYQEREDDIRILDT